MCAVLTAIGVTILGVLLGISAAQHTKLALSLLGVTAVLLLVARMGNASLVLIMALYAGFATLNVTSLSLGAKTLFLTPGDIGLLMVVVVVGIRVLLSASVTRRAVVTRPGAATAILFPLVLLGLAFLASSLLAAAGPFGYQINLARSLLFYSRWLAGPLMFVLAFGVSLSPGGLCTVVLFLAACLLTGFVAVLSGSPGGVAGALSAVALSQYFRAEGVFSDPNQLGQTSVLLFVVVASLLLSGPKMRNRLVLWMLAAFLALVVLLTQSREALATLVVSLAVLWWVLARRRRYLAVFFLSALLVGGMALAFQSPRVLETLTEIQGGATTVALNGRDQTWSTAVSMIASYPLTGIGFENLSSLTNGTVWQAHNGFLQSALVGGIWGFWAYVWLLISTGRILYRYSRRAPDGILRAILSGLFAVFVGYVLTALVSDHFITFYIYNSLFWGLAGLALAAATNESAKGEAHAGSSGSVPAV